MHVVQEAIYKTHAVVKSIMLLPEEILWKISEFMDPSLTDCIRLASVSQCFRRVFTSDKLWQYFNPYGVPNNIFESFELSLDRPLDYRLFRFYWVSGDPLTEPLTGTQLKALTQNQFVWLGYILRKFNYIEEFLAYPQLVKCAINLTFSRDTYVVKPEFLRESKEWALQLVRKRPELFHSFSKFWKDHDVIEAAASGTVTNYKYEPCLRRVHFDKTILNGPIGKIAAINDPRNLQHLDDELRAELLADRAWVLEAVKAFPDLLPDCEPYDDDTEVFWEAYRGSPRYLSHMSDSLSCASTRLCKNLEICRKAVAQSPTNINFCLTSDLELLKDACRGGEPGFLRQSDIGADRYGHALKTDNEAIELVARGLGPSFARFNSFPQIYTADFSTLLAVLKDPSFRGKDTLAFLPGKYTGDAEFIVKAIDAMGPATWAYVPDEMKRNKDVAFKALRLGIPLDDIEDYVGPIFSRNREMVKLSAQCTDQNDLFKIPSRFSDDTEIVEIAVSKRGCALQYASERLRNDPDVVLRALDTEVHLRAGSDCVCVPFKFVSPELLANKEFLESAATKVCAVPLHLLTTKKLALLALKQNPHYYRDLPTLFTDALDFNVEAAASSAGTLRFMREEMRTNPMVLQAANFEYKSTHICYCAACFD